MPKATFKILGGGRVNLNFDGSEPSNRPNASWRSISNNMSSAMHLLEPAPEHRDDPCIVKVSECLDGSYDWDRGFAEPIPEALLDLDSFTTGGELHVIDASHYDSPPLRARVRRGLWRSTIRAAKCLVAQVTIRHAGDESLDADELHEEERVGDIAVDSASVLVVDSGLPTGPGVCAGILESLRNAGGCVVHRAGVAVGIACRSGLGDGVYELRGVRDKAKGEYVRLHIQFVEGVNPLLAASADFEDSHALAHGGQVADRLRRLSRELGEFSAQFRDLPETLLRAQGVASGDGTVDQLLNEIATHRGQLRLRRRATAELLASLDESLDAMESLLASEKRAADALRARLPKGCSKRPAAGSCQG